MFSYSDFVEWGKYVIAVVAAIFGYGRLTNKVEVLKEAQKKSTDRIDGLETQVNSLDRSMEGLRVSIVNIEKNTDKIYDKLDRLLEKK